MALTVKGLREDDAVKVAQLTNQDDIAYLVTFERIMYTYSVDEVRWTFKLAPQLSTKAQQAYAAMPTEAAGDYKEVKILRHYDINEYTYIGSGL